MDFAERSHFLMLMIERKYRRYQNRPWKTFMFTRFDEDDVRQKFISYAPYRVDYSFEMFRRKSRKYNILTRGEPYVRV